MQSAPGRQGSGGLSAGASHEYLHGFHHAFPGVKQEAVALRTPACVDLRTLEPPPGRVPAPARQPAALPIPYPRPCRAASYTEALQIGQNENGTSMAGSGLRIMDEVGGRAWTPLGLI